MEVCTKKKMIANNDAKIQAQQPVAPQQVKSEAIERKPLSPAKVLS